ncbi:MAG: L-threonylcarbamoyladenylate synthase [Nannocystales bacterium]
MTRVLAVDAGVPLDASIEEAADVLRSGELVAFATETVYGLGADATQAGAVEKIFAAKGRPQSNPLIAHVASAQMARAWAGTWPEVAETLAAAFWPGPLTIIVPRSERIAAAVSAGLETVGLRVPQPAVARAVIEALGRPVAAPSANRSEHVSPTTAQHVLDDLQGRVGMVLDSGATGVGIESTVIDVTGSVPRLLRRGPVSLDALREVLGVVQAVDQHVGVDVPQASPGQGVRHYAPDVPCVRVEAGDYREAPGDGVVSVGHAVPGTTELLEPVDAARELYAVLRQLESSGVERIVVLMPPNEPQWAAVRDRLIRATVVA